MVVTNDGGLGVALGVGSLNGLTVDADGRVTALSGMLNGFKDFNLGGPIQPYVGLGIGVSRINADVDVLGVNIVDDSDTVLAFQGMVGVAYAITERASIFGGYRYFGTRDPSLSDASGAAFDSEYSSHNIDIGIRFRF